MANRTGTNHKVPVTIRGVSYPSMSAAANALKGAYIYNPRRYRYGSLGNRWAL